MPARVDDLRVSTYVVPTEAPESDGTFEWMRTTMVLVQLRSGSVTGLGYTYADHATAVFIGEHLRDVVVGQDAMQPQRLWDAMRHAIRNVGRPGVASMAMAAVDCAIWDLKARLLNIPLVTLLGARRDAVPLYGSGGFTSYPERELAAQMRRWIDSGLTMVKMKVGRDPAVDVQRVRIVRDAIGRDAELFVDANGAYTPREAIGQGERFADAGVTWFEEPVSSDDLAGLARVRRHLGDRMDIAAGEYGYDLVYFQRMLDAHAVDVIQADVTRCAGITELLRVAALCETRNVPLSLHTAPALHLHVACAVERVRHLEYFFDHERIERMFFDGFPVPVAGALAPDIFRPGNGLLFRERDAERFLLR
ncbi:MAG: enolase C-terminal domain-like protein [Gemmatimonadaceae bacterium]